MLFPILLFKVLFWFPYREIPRFSFQQEKCPTTKSNKIRILYQGTLGMDRDKVKTVLPILHSENLTKRDT